MCPRKRGPPIRWRSGVARGSIDGMLTFGVEEEFLLVDPRTGDALPVAGRVTAALPPDVLPHARLELRRSTLELAGPVCTGAAELWDHAARLRKAAAYAAAEAGAALVAVAATPGREADTAVPPDDRYRAVAARYGPVAADPACCALHVHVGVPDRELAVRVCDRLRPWLPVLRAMSANSPLSGGADTGHASWRSVQLLRWPQYGPGPQVRTAAAYDAAVRVLLDAGVLLDEGTVSWFARPSVRFPTVEVRVADVCASAGETALLAVLTRAAVATAIAAEEAGEPVPDVPAWLENAAHWAAARQGLGGVLLDVRDRRTRPAWDLVDEFAAAVAPAVRAAGDEDLAGAGLARLRAGGTGADRQRAVFARTGDVGAVVAAVAAETAAG